MGYVLLGDASDGQELPLAEREAVRPEHSGMHTNITHATSSISVTYDERKELVS